MIKEIAEMFRFKIAVCFLKKYCLLVNVKHKTNLKLRALFDMTCGSDADHQHSPQYIYLQSALFVN